MCIIIERQYVASRPIIAYKHVKKRPNGDFQSPIRPISRAIQISRGSEYGHGKTKTYRLGKTALSPIPKTAGIYLYARKSDIRKDRFRGEYAVLRVEVPAGATVREGYRSYYGEHDKPPRLLCASRIKVLNVCHPNRVNRP